MGRAPCCEKMGLNRGPWSKEEDRLLINYINQHGHGNWRALPKKAGLLRCGKSCRLRWINYLRPGIKRGNLSKEEEDTIIELHKSLGNRWSTIAARLPGRTDNEIKNVWHTHLKNRINQDQATTENRQEQDTTVERKAKLDHKYSKSRSLKIKTQEDQDSTRNSSPHSSCDTTTSVVDNPIKMDKSDATLDNCTELDQDFWVDVFSSQDCSDITDHHGIKDSAIGGSFNMSTHDDMDFWRDLFTKTEEISELLKF